MPVPAEIRRRSLAEEGSLAGDLVRGRPRALDLFPRSARTADPEPTAADASRCRLDPEAFRVSTAAAEARLEEILGGNGLLVTTGQQPVLFLGPLYVLYKTLAAVQLARRVEESTGRPALAVFWVGSDDHDWEEVGTARLLDTENRLRTLRLPPEAGWEERPVGPSPVPADIDALVDDISELLPESEFVDNHLKSIREAYRPGRTVAAAFTELLLGLVGERPLAVLDGAAPEVKRASVPLLRASLEEAAAERQALERGAQRVREAGYEPRVPVLDSASHVFLDTAGGRERIYVDGDRARAGREGATAELEDVLERLAEEPGRFSPNVALRPVLESWLLPVGYTVLGPGELAYWAQLPPLFRHRGVEVPRVRPRPAWTVVEGKIQKVLEKVDAGPGAFADGGEELVSRVVREGRPSRVSRAIGALKRALQERTEAVEEAVESELPGIRSSVGKARSRFFEAVGELEAAVDARVERRDELLVGQIRKAARHLHPDGRPQERVLNPFYYLARYGDDFVDAVDRAGRGEALLEPPGGDEA